MQHQQEQQEEQQPGVELPAQQSLPEHFGPAVHLNTAGAAEEPRHHQVMVELPPEPPTYEEAKSEEEEEDGASLCDAKCHKVRRQVVPWSLTPQVFVATYVNVKTCTILGVPRVAFLGRERFFKANFIPHLQVFLTKNAS